MIDIKLQPVPRVLLAFTDEDNPDEWETLCAVVRNYAREAVLRDRAANPRPTEQDPFGYFKAEPFGWTDCSPTDEGAIPLYERPAAPQPAQQERKPLTDEQIMSAIRSPGYDLEDMPDSWAFTLGVRFAERHHGITED